MFDLGRGSLASWDEAIYAGVAKEFARSGQWLELTLGGGLWLEKQPLCIWSTAFFYKIFGVNEFAARLFSTLCGIGTVLVVYFLGKKMFGRWTGFLAALVLLSSSHLIHYSRFGMMDVPLTFFISLALYFLWRGRDENRFLIYSGAAFGLAVMTKGFAAFFVVPLTWIYCIWTGETQILKRRAYWLGWLAALVIASPWHLYEWVMHRDAFMNGVVVKNFVERTMHAIEGHHGRWDYYIRTMTNKYHPWTLISIFSAPLFLFKAVKDRDKEIIFIASWIFTVFFIITLVQTKLRWYIIPLYPALSLSVAYYLGKVFSENQKNFVRVMFLVIMILHVPYSNIFNHDYSRDIKGIAPLVKKEVPEKMPVHLYNYHETPAATFYLERPNTYLDTPESFMSELRAKKEFYCLIHENDLRSFHKSLNALAITELGSFENLKLVSKKR